MARLRDSVARQSEAAQLELSRLSVEANGSRLLLEHHQHLLGHLGGRLEALGEQVAALAVAADSMNRSFSYDVRLQNSRLRDLRGLLGNTSADGRRLRAEQAALERQLRLELALLNNVTEELRLKDWEHSAALRNVSVIRGERQQSGGIGNGGMGAPVGRVRGGGQSVRAWRIVELLRLEKLSRLMDSRRLPSLVRVLPNPCGFESHQGWGLQTSRGLFQSFPALSRKELFPISN